MNRLESTISKNMPLNIPKPNIYWAMLERSNEVHLHLILLITLFDLYIIEIIMTYYEEKGKEDNIDQLQTVKESLLEENEKIKKFKQALKDKLVIYHQRIQFLKVWRLTFDSIVLFQVTKFPVAKDTDIEHVQNHPTEPTQTCTET